MAQQSSPTESLATKEWLSLKEVAAVLGINAEVIQRRARDGYFKTLSRTSPTARPKIHRDEVLELTKKLGGRTK